MQREGRLLGGGAIDRDVAVSCQSGKYGGHLGEGKVLANAATGSEPAAARRRLTQAQGP